MARRLAEVSPSIWVSMVVPFFLGTAIFASFLALVLFPNEWINTVETESRRIAQWQQAAAQTFGGGGGGGVTIGGAPMGRATEIVPNTCPAAHDASSWQSQAATNLYEFGLFGGKKQFVGDFYGQAHWPRPGRRSVLGPDHDLGDASRRSLLMLEQTIQDYNVQSMMDVPCGDVNWIFHSPWTDLMPLYVGLDIASHPIEQNRARFRYHTNKHFLSWDAVHCPLPQFRTSNDSSPQAFDLVHTRSALQRMPYKMAQPFLCNILSSGARVVMLTSSASNKPNDINQDTGLTFAHNLFLPPFDLPKSATTCQPMRPEDESDGVKEEDMVDVCVLDLQATNWVDSYLQEKCQASTLQ